MIGSTAAAIKDSDPMIGPHDRPHDPGLLFTPDPANPFQRDLAPATLLQMTVSLSRPASVTLLANGADADAADGRRTWQLILLATALRLVVALLLPLGVDESYAAVIARTLSLSYFDHPPAVFWLAHAAAWLGGESPIALRWPFVLLFALTSWLLFRLTSRLFSARAGFWAVCSAQLMPVFSLSDGSWVLPDGPLLCASVAAALALSHALGVSSLADDVAPSVASSAHWRSWVGVGLALGAAGLSKYHAALLGLGTLLFVATDARSRPLIRRVPPYAAMLIAALCTVPVFVWNAQHDWVSFRFQSGRAAGDGSPITALLQNVAGQAGYLLPWFWAPLALLLVRATRTGPRDRAAWFCVCLGAPPVIVFTLAALGGRPGLPHWPAPGWFLLLPLLGAAIARWELRDAATAVRRLRIAAAVFVSLLTIVVSHAATGWMTLVVPSLHQRDPAFELLEYRSIRSALDTTTALRDARFVATSDWMRGAKIGYALGPTRPTLVLNDDARHFRFATRTAPLIGTDGLLILRVNATASDAAFDTLVSPYVPLFDSLRFVATVPVLRGPDTALTVRVYAALRLRRVWSTPRTP